MEIMPGNIASITDITPNDKRVLAFIDQSEEGKPLAASFIAKGLSLARTQIVLSLNNLIQKNYIERCAKRRIGYIYRVNFRAERPKNFFLILDKDNSGYNGYRLTSLQLMVVSYLQLRQGDNRRSWWRQRCMANDLGCTQQQVSRATLALEEMKLVVIDHVNGGKGQNNQYQVLVTPSMRVFSRPEISTKNEPRTQYRAQLDKHNEMKNPDNPAACRPQKGAAAAACFDGSTAAKKELLPQPERCLSGKANTFDVEERKKLLLRQGIDQTTAGSIANDRRISYKSLCNLVANAYSKHSESGGLWRPRPGYFVQAINTAIAEGKQIDLSKTAEKSKAKADKALQLLHSQNRKINRPVPQRTGKFEDNLAAVLKARGLYSGSIVESVCG